MVVAGEDKAGAVGLALAGANPVQVPAAGPRGRRETLWLIDENAASRVPEQLVRKGSVGRVAVPALRPARLRRPGWSAVL